MSVLHEKSVNIVCPSAAELSIITKEVHCDKCNLIFYNESQFRMHDFKFHKRMKLEKTFEKNSHYHCPVETCIYASSNEKKYFASYKYLKQHFLKVHAEKKYTCPKCTKGFSTISAKEAHLRICGINFSCECSKNFSSYESLLTHARRHLHTVPKKYKLLKKTIPRPSLLKKQLKTSSETLNKTVKNKECSIYILPKPTCEKGIQTEEKKPRRKYNFSSKNQSLKNKICKQTQTFNESKAEEPKKSAETQTSVVPKVIRVCQVGNSTKISLNEKFQVNIRKENSSLIETFSLENLMPNSPLSMPHDVGFRDLLEDRSTLGTQTSPEKNVFNYSEEYITQSNMFKRICKSDPMLTEKTFADRFSSTETQTEKKFCKSIFDTDPSSSNNETQTTEEMIDSIETNLIYNNNYTQTCDEIFSPDLELTDIQTQTAWCDFDDTTVSTETQTKNCKCQYGCNDVNLDCRSWFTTQTNHMETQTDLFSIFDNLEC